MFADRLVPVDDVRLEIQENLFLTDAQIEVINNATDEQITEVIKNSSRYWGGSLDEVHDRILSGSLDELFADAGLDDE